MVLICLNFEDSHIFRIKDIFGKKLNALCYHDIVDILIQCGKFYIKINVKIEQIDFLNRKNIFICTNHF